MDSLGSSNTSTSSAAADNFHRAYQLDGFGDYAQLQPLATLVRLQLWDEVLAQPATTLGISLLEGYGSYARGMAYAHTGRLDQAKAEPASVKRLQNLATALRAQMYGEPIPARLMALAHDTLACTLARTEQRFEQATALLRKAADIECGPGGVAAVVVGLGALARLAQAAQRLMRRARVYGCMGSSGMRATRARASSSRTNVCRSNPIQNSLSLSRPAQALDRKRSTTLKHRPTLKSVLAF